MVLALVAVILVTLVSSTQPLGPVIGFMAAAIIIGAIIGIWRAKTVQMTAMPQLVAMLHSFVGAAPCSWPSARSSRRRATLPAAPRTPSAVAETGLAIFIGAVTLTGSVIAYLKLAARISGKPSRSVATS